MLGLLVHDVVGVDVDVLFLLVVRLRHHVLLQAGGEASRPCRTSGWTSRPWPEMIRGVRASSMRMESTSSTMAKAWPRWTSSLA